MRDWMIKLREDKQMTLGDMAILCDVGYWLLESIEEDDWITHPNLADRVAAGYGMNVVQRNALCAEQHHVKVLEVPVVELEVRANGKREMYIKINVDCIRALMDNEHMNKYGISTRLAYSATWLHESLERGTMRPSDIKRLAHILRVKPDQLKATNPER